MTQYNKAQHNVMKSIFRFMIRFIMLSVVLAECKEPLLKGKAQYCWPPHYDSLFCKEKNIFSVLQAADLN
jgi:hypothetical protein